MKNQFGQDITPGSIVGLGIRAGNSSEQRVGIVLELFSEPRRWYGRPEDRPENHVDRYGKCAWYDPSPQWKWNAKTESSETFYRPNHCLISKQQFRFFLLDPATIDPEILARLQTAYAQRD